MFELLKGDALDFYRANKTLWKKSKTDFAESYEHVSIFRYFPLGMLSWFDETSKGYCIELLLNRLAELGSGSDSIGKFKADHQF